MRESRGATVHEKTRGADTTNAASALARASAHTRVADATDEVRQRVADILLDTLAVMALGSDAETHMRLQALLGSGGGDATVIGRRRPVPAAVAAVLNGTTPTVYQIDEGMRESRGHPGIHIVPVAFALAEERGASATALFSAIIAGYEVAARLGQSLGGTKSDIHPHGNWGTIGAAVAAAYLFADADEEVIATAIDIAAGLTLYADRAATTAGSGTHHLMASLGGHVGLVAGAAAASGMTATRGCLERFMAPRSGTDFQADLLLAGIDAEAGVWSRHLVLESYFKFWPACAHTHTVINALLALRDTDPFGPDDVASIDVRAFSAAAALTATEVDNDLAARFSIPFVAAATIIDEGYGLDSLRPEILSSAGTAALARRVHIEHDRALDAGYPRNGRPVELTVHLKDGRCLTATKSVSFGDTEMPATRDVLRAKARELFTHRFGSESASERILSAVVAVEGGADLKLLSKALRAAGHE